MRTTCVLALVVSLVVMTGCCSISGPDGGGCGGGIGAQFNGSCASGGCDSGGGFFSGFGGGGGCDSGGCATGNCGGTSQTFSDLDCGPMCGAHLDSSQVSGGGAGFCDSCQVGQSFAKRNWNSIGKGLPRPCFSRPNFALPNPFAGVAGKMACMKAGFGSGFGGGGFGSAAPAESCGPTEPYVDPCNNYGCGGLAGTCKGLGGAVGCGGCGECGGGGGAIGTSHSDYSNGTPGLAGRVAGRVGGLRHRAGCGCLACKSGAGGGNRSHHPYGGELPHTAAADGAATGAGAAAPTYAYPYYTTRGPRDFLQDGCGPPPVYPYNPRVSCLPSIGR